MAELEFSLDWMGSDSPDPLLRDTAALLKITIGDRCLTRNIDCLARTVHDFVSVSVHPLAMWLAQSWWRLNNEPFPISGGPPRLEWRMAHALGAADQGFVWPDVLLIPDGEQMIVWTDSFQEPGQSVLYVPESRGTLAVSLDSFRRSAGAFIDLVVHRLEAMGHDPGALGSLWQLIREDSDDPGELRRRRLEALLGFDPEECPDGLLEDAVLREEQIGLPAISELLPVLGPEFQAIDDYRRAPGLMSRPQSVLRQGRNEVAFLTDPPWEQGRKAASALRRKLGLDDAPVSDELLHDLLGFSMPRDNASVACPNLDVGVGRPDEAEQWRWFPRKRHPLGQRFEMARFIGALFCRTTQGESWIISSDLASASQKRQRAFAAEFLCPIQPLMEFLDDRFSESAREKAAEHFMVSERIVDGNLRNRLPAGAYLDD